MNSEGAAHLLRSPVQQPMSWIWGVAGPGLAEPNSVRTTESVGRVEIPGAPVDRPRNHSMSGLSTAAAPLVLLGHE